uniref:Uncharacterized protein n=1 Tax=Ascaris lumbricoides TaxID=6252 RepID=A0A0M3IRQ7_ASCLU
MTIAVLRHLVSHTISLWNRRISCHQISCHHLNQ